MAGKRQHYVPQLLQRGFLLDPLEDAERTWLHRRGVKARPVSIRDIGVEDWFYSRKSQNGEPTLDDAITDLESEVGPNVRAMRKMEPGTSFDAKRAAWTVVHLVTRTAHLRRTLSSSVSTGANEFEALFADPSRLASLLGLVGPELASVTTDAIRRSAADLVAADIPAALTERMMSFVIREMGDQVIGQIAESFKSLFPQLFEGLGSKVRDAHNEMIGRMAEKNGWLDALSTFRWRIEAGRDLILPDAVALARTRDGALLPILFTSAADAELVAMPIASERILVGRRDPAALLDLATFNDRAAASSEVFFIAAKPMDALALDEKIGTAVAASIDELIIDVIREAEDRRSSSDEVISAAEPRKLEGEASSCDFELIGFGDEVLAEELAKILRTVIGILGREMPFHELEGITLAADYERALANIDRGDPALPSVRPDQNGNSQEVGKRVIVFREGVQKTHLVIDARLAEAWLSPYASARATSLNILINLLAGIGYSTRYAAARELNVELDVVAREFHPAVGVAPSVYWSAKRAAFIAPERGRCFANSIVGSIEDAQREIAVERAGMVDGTDVEATILKAIECASAILGNAAKWLGHNDGLDDGWGAVDDDIPSRLRPWGLDRWIVLFGRELSACFTPEDAIDVAMVATLSRHVERLLWSFGLYCWQDGEAVRAIVTDRPLILPLAEEANIYGAGGASWS